MRLTKTASALVLSLGIAIQNFPEGAIISMPLRAEGESKGRAFLGGVLSGVVEPIGAVLTILAAQLVIPALPYFLSFAAGARLYKALAEGEMMPAADDNFSDSLRGLRLPNSLSEKAGTPLAVFLPCAVWRCLEY